MRKIKYVPQLVAAIIISELAGVIGSLFTTTAINGWYTLLVRPSFAPPNWVFGPVWTTLFVLMGIASFLVWRKGKTEALQRGGVFPKRARTALTLFGIQLVLNTLWSIIFFGSENLGGAFVEIIFLWIAIVATIVAFYRISKPAAYLLLPYIAWVTFAAYLNYAFWQLN
ncbi:MAG TPA: tryptophan-rich sensory protein [Candidatus Paceibacterota bacterium]|nr:tryptophan-rich sensory protein [Candidatus Paceibacterota bacterium]